MPSSPFSSIIDDKDFDDATLWAVIDSAVASHSASAAKHQKPLAIKYPNFQSPPTPISHPSPPQNPNQHHQRSWQEESSRPPKVGRTCAERNQSPSPLALVKGGGAQRTPSVKSVPFSSPESYLSPEIRRFGNGVEVSPAVSCGGRSESEDEMRHCLSGRFPSVSLFKDYQNAALAILEKADYTIISGRTFIKKTGWRKISFYFNISYEIRDKTIEFDENRSVQRAEFVVRAYMRGGRFSDGWGSCERREKKFVKPNHDIPSTAETRAKTRACQDLLGIGEYCPGGAGHSQR